MLAQPTRTAVYGPVRTVVWQGSAGDRRPYADQQAISNPNKNGPPRQDYLRDGDFSTAIAHPLDEFVTQVRVVGVVTRLPHLFLGRLDSLWWRVAEFC